MKIIVAMFEENKAAHDAIKWSSLQMTANCKKVSNAINRISDVVNLAEGKINGLYGIDDERPDTR